MKRRLSLKSEHLTQLTPDVLASVAGAAPPTRDCEVPSIDYRCLTGMYPSINEPCSLTECIEIRQTLVCTV
jgi:hypothetical protein